MAETSTRATGKWAQPGIPHRGWACVDVEDLGEPTAICEMCESQEIRYVHQMEHPNHKGSLGCGCICAGRMEEDYEGARRREQVFRNAASRRGRWLLRKWKTSSKGNPYLNADGYNVTVFPLDDRVTCSAWGFQVRNRETEYVLRSRKSYPSSDAAKLRAFDAIIWLKERSR